MGKEIREKREALKQQANDLYPYVLQYKKIELKMEQLQGQCEHETAYYISSYTDSYEGRTYDSVACPDCGAMWDDRVFCGKHTRPHISEVEVEDCED